MLFSLVPVYRFVGSMIWFREYLGDYKVFWGITKISFRHIYDHHVFAYPPTGLLLFWPFGKLSFLPSLISWSAAGTAAVLFATRGAISPRALALGFVTYAGIGVLLGGQISLFIGALILGALRTKHPSVRGLLLATAAMIKPQSIMAAPVALIAQRNWTAILWAGATAAALFLLTVALFGFEIWLRWLTELPRFHAYLVDREIDRLDVGLYGFARSVGMPGWIILLGVPLGILTSWLVFGMTHHNRPLCGLRGSDRPDVAVYALLRSRRPDLCLRRHAIRPPAITAHLARRCNDCQRRFGKPRYRPSRSGTRAKSRRRRISLFKAKDADTQAAAGRSLVRI